MKLKTKLGILLLLYSLGSHAQYGNQVHFKNISVKDGLSFPVITCILQDQKGFIWVGTEVGLNKYDSQKFKIYYADPDKVGSLSNDHITCLYEDNRRHLWVGTFAGLNIYDRSGSTFKKFTDGILKNERILAVTGDKKGNNWVLTRKFLVLVSDSFTIRKKYHHSDLAPPQSNVSIFSTAKIDRKGCLWVNTNRGLRMFDPQTEKLEDPLNDQEDYLLSNVEFFSVIYFDKNDRIWVAGRGNGLKYFDPQSRKWTRVKNLSSRFINGLVEDIDNKMWICSGRNGLNIYDPLTDQVELIRYADQPESNFVSNSLSCIYSDNAGGIWIGTFNNGLQYYFQHQLKFNLYYSKGQISGINSNYITSFAIDRGDNIWMGAGEEGLLYFNRKTRSFRNVSPENIDFSGIGGLRENFYILTLKLSEDQEHLFIGTLTGFFDYHIRENSWRFFHHQQKQSSLKCGGFVSSIAQYGNIVYLATFEGLFQYNLQEKAIDLIQGPVGNFQIVALAQQDSFLLLGSRYHGLWRYAINTKKLEKIGQGAGNVRPPDRIRTILLDSKGRIIISSGFEDLVRFDSSFSKVEKIENRLQNKRLTFMAICEDPDAGYWMATNLGLVKVNENWQIEKIFDQNEGFEPTYFMRSAIEQTPGGEILIGGNTGFCSFFSSNFHSPVKAPTEIHLTDFLLLNKSVVESEVAGFKITGDLEETKIIRLPTYQNLLTFEYAAIDFHNPSRIGYAYKLEPYESDWNDVSNRRFATYRDLPAGAYTFHVKYQIDKEPFSNQFASIQVFIPARPWQTWWAYMLYAAVLFAILRQFYLYRRNRQKLRQEIGMQKFQKEKIEELYNFKLDFFTQLTHELRTPLTLVISPLEEIIRRNTSSADSNLLKIIHRNTQKLLLTVNQILDFRKIENSNMKVFAKKGNIVAFAEEILYSFLRITDKKGITLHFETNMEKYPYVLFDKDIVEKILVNLISNAVKFTQKGRISLKVYEPEDRQASAHYFIELSDTGRGIEPENLPKIFESFFQERRDDDVAGSGIGLKIVKELTRLHHGAIEVNSKVSKGTTFLLSFPKADLDLVSEEPIKPSIAREVERSHPQDSPPREKTSAEGSAKILIVDDESDVLAFLEEIFEEQYQVYSVDSAQRAIEIARAEMPDLIISDVMMPDMDGYELCGITKSDFLLSHIPVVLLTALSTTEHRIEGLKTGADAYIAKPFPVNLLKATVQNLLDSRQKLRQAFLNSSINNAGELTQNNSDQHFINEVIALIDERLDETELEISVISDALGMSPSTFYRKLKSLTGLSGNEFIRTVRLKRAMEYLKTTDLNISEIAYRVGFSDPKYFSTCFKKYYNVTPTEFVAQGR